VGDASRREGNAWVTDTATAMPPSRRPAGSGAGWRSSSG
jgi:hypothetical protein